MKYIDAELIKSTKGLYNDIDSCIDELLKARVGHNQENEGKALFRMEGLMVATLQQLDCIIDSFQQKQPDLPGIEESGIPGKDYIPVEWVDACEKFGKWKIVKQEQPKVDLNKKIKKELRLHYNDDQDVYWWNYLKNSFRHFYEFGLNARKEE